MPLVNIPEQRKWTQPNTSVLFGNIYSTYNIDFSLPGFIKLAPRTRYVGREDASTSTFDYTLSIVYMSPGNLFGTKKYYILTNDTVFTIDTDLTNFADIGLATDPNLALASDAVASGLYYVVSTQTDMSVMAGASWTNGIINTAGGAALDSNATHPLCVGFDGNIAIGNRNKICKWTTNASGNPTTYAADVMSVPLAHTIQWIRSFNDSYWIGTRNLINGNAALFQWDGAAATFDKSYEVDTQWLYSGVEWQGNFYVFTSDGRLMNFNGAGFTEVARLPAYTDYLVENDYRWGNSFQLGAVHQHGVAVIDGLIHVAINSEAFNGTITPDATQKLCSGIWVYDPAVGFYHKYGLSNSSATTDFGQPALDAGAVTISPLFLDPTSSGGPSAAVGGTLLYGARLSSGTATNYYVLGSVTTGDNRGNFTTSRIESPEVQESWRYVWIKYDELQSATDTIVLKYKTKDRENLPFTTSSDVTWTSTTVFTSTDTGFANVVVGDEVSVLSGDGAGSTAHISAISYSNPTYTVTLDEAITDITASDEGIVAVDNYHKLSPTITETTATTEQPNVTPRHAKLTIPVDTATDYQPAPSEWLQLKVEMRGENVRISGMSVLSETQTKTII